MPLEELPHDKTHALVHNQLGEDQERQCEEEAQLRFDIIEKRHSDTAAHRSAGERGEGDQRQPGGERDYSDTPAHEVERVAREMPAANQLVQRPAENEREVL